MAVAHTAAVDLPVARVGDRELMHEGAQIAVASGPKHQVSVVRQETRFKTWKIIPPGAKRAFLGIPAFNPPTPLVNWT